MRRRLAVIATGFVLGLLGIVAVRSVAGLGWFGGSDLDRSTARMREVLELVRNNYVDPKASDYDQLTNSALHGMVEILDPHSEYMEKRDYKSLQEEISGKFGGVGIQVEMREGRIVVIAPVAGGPGERAGILRGDAIIGVDGKPLDKDVPMSDVLERLRGEPRKPVSLTLSRPGTPQPIELTVVREVIKLETVRDVHLLPGKVGYVLLTEFSESTGEEFGHALAALRKQGMTSLVLDVRNNPGGLLDSAVRVAENFFASGELVVYTQGRTPADREEFRAGRITEPLTLPLAVLINSNSASAAEIVAGALKDTGRAVIVGERSFGKGSVQSIIRLKSGEGLRLTTGRYYTPGGVSIHEIGIQPQVEIVLTTEDDRKLRVQHSRPDVTEPGDFKERFGFAPIEDRQLLAATDVLKGIVALAGRAAAVVH